MMTYLSAGGVVEDLHQRGFTDNFELKGNSLLWIQNRVVLDQDQFVIIECHRFLDVHGNKLIICGIVSGCHEVKGILINRYNNFTDNWPPVIAKKIKNLFANACIDESLQGILIFTGNFKKDK